MQLLGPQQVQEDIYEYPYHYSVQFKDEFSLCRLFDWGMNYAATVEFLLQKVAEDQGILSIVDIGCGDGRLTRELHEHIPNVRLAGIDYSERSIQMAKGLNYGLGIDFRTLDILVDCPEEQFDTAILMEVYEHIEPASAVDFLQGVHRLLERDGILHVTVPHANVSVASHHFRHFTVAGLTSELEAYFDILQVIPFQRQSLYRRWLMRCLVNRLFILNHHGAKNMIYHHYKRRLFFVEAESQCERIYVKCRKRA